MTKVQPNLLDAVALLSDQSDLGLVLGQVGTVVELLDDDFALVEFCDRDGATFSMPTLPIASLLRLSYEQVAARLRGSSQTSFDGLDFKEGRRLCQWN
jgi:hypothetical protein